VNHSRQLAVSGPGSGDARWANDRLISIQDIRRIFSLGRTAAYELTHRPEFPQPVLVSQRCHRWWASEVDTFVASLRSESPVPRHTGDTRQAAKGSALGSATPQRRITGRVRPARARRKET
jgi:predicted DNA-binding transcriptional regulator AlpA